MRGLPSGSFRTQLVVLTAAVTAFGVVVLTVVVQVVLARSTTTSLDTVLEDRAEAVISSVSAGPGGGLVVPDARLDAGVAVYDGDGTLAAGSVPSSESRIYEDLSTTTARRFADRAGDDESRVLAEPFTTGGVSGVVVVTERLAPYERAEQQALYVCAGAGLLMVLLAAGLAQWVSRRALAPVAAMTRSADEWSEHDLGHRFDLGPGTTEISALGSTLDRLLERVATAIRSEQRLTSELAHELRTPLTAIQANADLALLHPGLPDDVRDALDDIGLSARRMGGTIESLLELARSETTQALGRQLPPRRRRRTRPSRHRTTARSRSPWTRRSACCCPNALALRAISPVLENARRLAGRVVVTTETSRAGFVDLCIDDDGPGIPDDQRELVFEPGRTTGTGAGLGLALSRRVARSMGGDVRIGDGPLRTRVVVTLPCS